MDFNYNLCTAEELNDRADALHEQARQSLMEENAIREHLRSRKLSDHGEVGRRSNLLRLRPSRSLWLDWTCLDCWSIRSTISIHRLWHEDCLWLWRMEVMTDWLCSPKYPSNPLWTRLGGIQRKGLSVRSWLRLDGRESIRWDSSLSTLEPISSSNWESLLGFGFCWWALIDCWWSYDKVCPNHRHPKYAVNWLSSWLI